MERPRPMDMLVCGDVGFGKTEVAMRAVFKCVMSGRQAMVLCPTTVLSSQHYKTFKERMDSFGINIALLNRFTTVREKKEILAKLASGEMDVVIGTHAVLSKKIECRHLGLLWWMKNNDRRCAKGKWNPGQRSWISLRFGNSYSPHASYEPYRCAGYGGDDTAACEPTCHTDLCDRV